MKILRINTLVTHLLGLLATAAIGAALTGCSTTSTAPAPGGTVAYEAGELVAYFNATMPEVVAAANAAIPDIPLAKISEENAPVSVKLRTRDSLDRSVLLTVSKVTGTCTSLGIRVGTFGDREFSERVLDKVKRAL